MPRSWKRSCHSSIPRATQGPSTLRSGSTSNGALAVIQNRVIPDTHLVAYGHGDWNDSLQPANPIMRERLCSAWTVTLHYQTLTTFAEALRHLGLAEFAAGFEATAADVREDLQRLLIVDDILVGLAHFEENGHIDYLLHPRDQATGISYSLLPMINAVTHELLTPEQARSHLGAIERHLLGPDGARLFDRPMEYHGGLQKNFQRAESSAFFGREIGLMYTHAHLRYAEALWRYGDAEGFLRALCKANPIAIQSLIPAATLRQSNCFFSSSDAVFGDRYQAFAEYSRVMRSEIPLDGGWRVYSSGAGIAVSLILRCFLGFRQERSTLVIDPVIPASLDGLRVEVELAKCPVEVTYRIKGTCCGPVVVNLNGAELPFARGKNQYRKGGAEVPMAVVLKRLTTKGPNRLIVRIE